MTEHQIVTNSGLVSLSGFAYQMKVFLLLLSQTGNGQQVEFETLDDVVVSDIIDSSKPENHCFQRIKTYDGTIKAVQVKQADVSASVSRKILYNWLLAYSIEPSISSFVLYSEEGCAVSQAAFENAEKEYKTIENSAETSTALISRVKKIYDGDFERFEKDYNYIVSNKSVVSCAVDSALSNVLQREFHATAGTIGPAFFDRRIKELFNRICSRIIDCALVRKAYICTNGEFEQLCEEICRDISPDRYEPDYQAFSKTAKPLILNEELKACREYQQLAYCDLPVEQIIDHMRWEQYYENIRQHYLLDAHGDTIISIEGIAFYNHQGVITELQGMDKDTPKLRLVKTKVIPITNLENEFSRWGAYVYLTRDDTQNQISWKDDENGA